MGQAVLTVEENKTGRDFVVGDIHGAYALLDEALKRVNFDPEKDRLFCVGDLIDKGPDSPRCLEYLAQPWFYAIQGNHEDIFLGIAQEDGELDIPALAGNMQNGNGVEWMLHQPPEKIKEMREAFLNMPVAIEIKTSRGTVGLVHAEVPAGMDWETFKQKVTEGDEATLATAKWGRTRYKKRDRNGVVGIDRIFFGHYPVESGPVRFGNCFYIDTGAAFHLLEVGKSGADLLFMTIAEITSDTGCFQVPHIRKPDGVHVIDRPAEPGKPFTRRGLSNLPKT